MPKTLHRLWLGLFVAAIGFSHVASAAELDAAEAFSDAIQDMERIYRVDTLCNNALNQSWDTFSGVYNYEYIEKDYLNGAANATLCGLRRGYWLSLMLDELANVVANGSASKGDERAAVKQASEAFMRLPMNLYEKFTNSIQCVARTPQIRANGSFTNTVSVTCTTNKGPVSVNLRSMRIQLAGQDIWNGPEREYLGRSMHRALNARGTKSKKR